MALNSHAKNLGDRLFEEVKHASYLDTEPWVRDLVDRVNLRLQSVRGDKEPFEVHVPWLSKATAFTAPGQHIYFSRYLLQFMQEDEQVAFVIAHEMAHHDCNHVASVDRWFQRLFYLSAPFFMIVIENFIDTMINGIEREFEADAYALDLCRAAGYEPEKCIAAFDALKIYALDRGAIRAVFGDDKPENESFVARIMRRLSYRAYGYPAIIERQRALMHREPPSDTSRDHMATAGS